MATRWIKIDNLDVDLEVIPGLLDRYNLLPTFIRRLLETKNTHQIRPSKEDQISFNNRFLADNNIKGKDNLSDWLSQNGLDEKRLDLMLYERLQVEIFKQDSFDKNVASIFLKRKESLDRVMYSIMRVETREEAEELHLKLEEKEASFSELASEYALGSEKEFNGMIGPVELRVLDANLSERLKISKTGQLWPPFEFKSFWIVLRLEKHLPSSLDENMRKRLRNELYEEFINKQVLELVEQIRKTDTSKIKGLKPKSQKK